jgi:hypothetical protein
MCFTAGAWRPLAKLNPPQSPDFRPTFSGITHLQGVDMQEQFEIIDLGDAMTETRCAATPGAAYDFLYGPGRWHC